MKGAYICKYHGVTVIVEMVDNADEARRIFVEYLKKYKEAVVRPKAVSARWVPVVNRQRGFVEVI